MNSDWKQGFKREVYEQFARIGKALASGARIELLDLLSQSERSVEQLADLTGMAVANVSQHLQVLRRARMVEVRREGLYSFYRLADESVFRVWQAMRTLGQARLLEIERIVKAYLKDRASLEPVTADELARRLEEGGVVVLDVRPREEYRSAHIRGARSIPVNELKKRLQELPRRQEIVAYCRGPYCVQSDAAVELLNKNGFRARRLEVGLPDWRAIGLPVELGTSSCSRRPRVKRPVLGRPRGRRLEVNRTS